MGNKLIFERNRKNECLISGDELIGMLTTNIKHGYGYYHLTRWSSLCKTLEPVTVPDDNVPHLMFHLGAAVYMNDESDKRCGKRVFFSSFSFGPPENISMWTNYGIPNEEAVRVKFPNSVIARWVKDFKAGRIGVYGVDANGYLKSLSARASLEMVDVAYWSKKTVGRDCHDENEGLFFYDNDKYRLTPLTDVEILMGKKPYCFKEFGWNYEKETRLVLKFDEDLADRFKRVAVTFDYPLQIIDKSFSKLVWQGPWFKQDSTEATAAGHRLSEAQPSNYIGKVRMRSVCDSCSEQDKKNCKCPYKGQR